MEILEYRGEKIGAVENEKCGGREKKGEKDSELDSKHTVVKICSRMNMTKEKKENSTQLSTHAAKERKNYCKRVKRFVN